MTNHYFADKVAIVTGGASGIGLAISEELARRGAVVTVADVDEAAAAEAAARIVEAGGRGQSAVLDVAEIGSLEALVDSVVQDHSRLDLMVNNAGIGWTGELYQMDSAHARRIVDINLNGVVYGSLAAYSVMHREGSGHIVNTGSFFSGLVPVPGLSVYSATKHGIVGFSLAMRQEARSSGVGVSVVCPSFVPSNIDQSSERVLDGAARDVERSAVSNEAKSLASAVLKGVERNRALIIRPHAIRPFWWLYRLSPRLVFALQYPIVARMLGRADESRFAISDIAPLRWILRLLVRRRGKSDGGQTQ